MIRDAVRRFVDDEVAPSRRRARARRPAALRHPAQDVRDVRHGRDGARAVQAADRTGEGRRPRGERRPTAGGTSAGGDSGAVAHPDHRAVPRAAPAWSPRWASPWASRRAAIMSQGHDRAEGAVGARPPHAGQGRRVGDHRAGLGLRRVRLDASHGAPRRRRLRAQRLEDVHHQRAVRRHHRVHLQARRRQPARAAQGAVVRARPRHAGLRAVEAAAQDGHALLAHRRAVPRRRPRRPRPADRRDRGPAGRRPRGGEGHLRPGARRRRRDGARHHRGVPAAQRAVRQGPRAVRQADR